MKSTKWPPCWLHDQMPAPGFRGHRMPRVYYDIDTINIKITYIQADVQTFCWKNLYISEIVLKIISDNVNMRKYS